MGGQKRSFFVIIINIKQHRQARQESRHPAEKSRHPVVKRDLVVHDETDEIPAWTTQKMHSHFSGPGAPG